MTSGASRYGVLIRPDITQLKSTGMLEKGTMIADLITTVEMQLAGLVTTTKEVTEHRDRAKKFLRAPRKGPLYMMAHPEETTDAIQKRVPGSPRAAILDDVKGSIEDMDEDGAMPVESAAKELQLRGELLGISADKMPEPRKVYDFSLVLEVNKELQATGWKAAR
jgi:ABC-type nitrate/sulfonate/bicarbonate transport system substrate-binding protein